MCRKKSNATAKQYAPTRVSAESFTLCDSSDEGRVSDAISDGVNAGLQKAANEGYDIYDIDRVDADGVSLYADNPN